MGGKRQFIELVAALVFAALGFFLCSTAHAEPINIDALVNVIALAESSNNPNAVGDHGRARGLCQIKREVWEKFAGSREPFSMAFNPALNKDIAALHCYDIINRHGFTDPARVVWLYNVGEPAKLSFHAWKKRQPNATYRKLYAK